MADIVAATFEPGSCICPGDYKAYNSLEKMGYEHHTVNHRRGNMPPYITTRFTPTTASAWRGLLKWWLKKHRGVSKQNPDLYVKSYEFIRNHRHCDDAGRLLAALSVALGAYQDRETYNDYNTHLAEIVQKRCNDITVVAPHVTYSHKLDHKHIRRRNSSKRYRLDICCFNDKLCYLRIFLSKNQVALVWILDPTLGIWAIKKQNNLLDSLWL